MYNKVKVAFFLNFYDYSILYVTIKKCHSRVPTCSNWHTVCGRFIRQLTAYPMCFFLMHNAYTLIKIKLNITYLPLNRTLTAWGCSSVGRAHASHAWGLRFDSLASPFFAKGIKFKINSSSNLSITRNSTLYYISGYVFRKEKLSMPNSEGIHVLLSYTEEVYLNLPKVLWFVCAIVHFFQNEYSTKCRTKTFLQFFIGS